MCKVASTTLRYGTPSIYFSSKYSKLVFPVHLFFTLEKQYIWSKTWLNTIIFLQWYISFGRTYNYPAYSKLQYPADYALTSVCWYKNMNMYYVISFISYLPERETLNEHNKRARNIRERWQMCGRFVGFYFFLKYWLCVRPASDTAYTIYLVLLNCLSDMTLRLRFSS